MAQVLSRANAIEVAPWAFAGLHDTLPLNLQAFIVEDRAATFQPRCVFFRAIIRTFTPLQMPTCMPCTGSSLKVITLR